MYKTSDKEFITLSEASVYSLSLAFERGGTPPSVTDTVTNKVHYPTSDPKVFEVFEQAKQSVGAYWDVEAVKRLLWRTKENPNLVVLKKDHVGHNPVDNIVVSFWGDTMMLTDDATLASLKTHGKVAYTVNLRKPRST